ncbi:hypothetical protein E0493_22510 [Roseomonas sp. M0104]|uniref:Uncharacterized protein n=1 Tax=Teichococcus coralli TaxID=2545983 RepID=A0A845BGI6_9PROT|nr:hypothetical protein [Pseudoroseomonas coralli]MXP66115.1 hypothetical protein [Pseudoroseomonas coralli]
MSDVPDLRGGDAGRAFAETFKFYEDGKHRRYSLLFAVNGGALTVAKLFADPQASRFLGGLTLGQLAAGLVIFTLAMGVDIWVFGLRMRERSGTGGKSAWRGVFSMVGRIVLAVICALIVCGWLQVMRGAPA